MYHDDVLLVSMKKVLVIRLLVSAALLLILFFFWTSFSNTHSFFKKGLCERGVLCVSFLDVGQGDATFIESPSGVQVLIDGGPGSNVLRQLAKHMRFFDRTIDVVVATHPDKDHIAGLVDVLLRYEVSTIVLTENNSATPAATQFESLVEQEDAEIIYARRGQTFDLGMGALLTTLFPDRNPEDLESNTASIISRLTYGETSFVFTGDAPQSVERYLVSLYGIGLQSDVLKVGHHGSKTSTAETFVSAVDPDYAVISSGKNNRYGHPHQQVVDILDASDIETKNTAYSGSIMFRSDGNSVEFIQ